MNNENCPVCSIIGDLCKKCQAEVAAWAAQATEEDWASVLQSEN